MEFTDRFIDFIQRRTELKYISTREPALSIIDSIDALVSSYGKKEISRSRINILLNNIRESHITIEEAITYIADSLRTAETNSWADLDFYRTRVINALNDSLRFTSSGWFNELIYIEKLHISKKNLLKYIAEDFGVEIKPYKLKEITTLTQLCELIPASGNSISISSLPSDSVSCSDSDASSCSGSCSDSDACSCSGFETATKENVIKEFDVLSELYRKAIESISQAKIKHNKLITIQKEFIDELKSVFLEIQTNINELRKEIVWDHLVVGFFGETNAGKSTTIETLRLKYGKGDRNWVHGAIVGDGQADFTKDASEYELDIDGKHVTLIDIPGIEGDESKYAAVIKKALRRAHYVFYVHAKSQQPDEKIAFRIKEYLADWTARSIQS